MNNHTQREGEMPEIDVGTQTLSGDDGGVGDAGGHGDVDGAEDLAGERVEDADVREARHAVQAHEALRVGAVAAALPQDVLPAQRGAHAGVGPHVAVEHVRRKLGHVLHVRDEQQARGRRARARAVKVRVHREVGRPSELLRQLAHLCACRRFCLAGEWSRGNRSEDV